MHRKKTYGRLTFFTVTVVFGFLLLRYILLPSWIKNHIDGHLANLEGYEATYSDFSLSLLSGSFEVFDVELKKTGGKIHVPFFKTREIRFAIQREYLMEGVVVSKVIVRNPTVNFIKSRDAKSSQTKLSSAWLTALTQMSYFPINQISIEQGSLRYLDYSSSPRVQLRMTDLNVKAENLHNVRHVDKVLSASVDGTARVDDARINMEMQLNSFFKSPMFMLTAELVNLDLFILKDFLKAYGGMDVEQGIFSLYTHASTRNNKIVGYVKPEISDITIASHREDHKFLGPRIGADNKFVHLAGNHHRLNEIQFEGNLDDAQPNIWDAVTITLHNAFIEGLMTTLETSSPTKANPAPIIRPKANVSRVSSADGNQNGIFMRLLKRKDKSEDIPHDI